MRLKIILATTTIFAGFLLWQNICDSKKVDFNTEIKPIFNKKCIACHGGVKQSGGFNLLTRDLALRPTENGKLAIVPGDPDASELIQRISNHDPEIRMPFKKEPLSQTEIELFKRWISQGAEWGIHWAYQPVQKPKVPSSQTALGFFGRKTAENQWIRNDIDRFVFEKLKEKKLTPNPEADRPTLLRRLALDLTGLPAPQNLSEKFLADTSEFAYQNLVDSLLAAPSFGERWASVWLDLARYADSKGYERDARRFAWRYRDWLIRAFNVDMPYNQFLTEQIAGDLFPQPTDAQLIATTFHRNTPTNDEGGTDNEEYRTAAVLDRVNTTWEAVLGTTFGCVQCHSHPYDPFFHDEFYKFAAFFNNTRDADTYDDFPLLRIYSGADSAKFSDLKNWLTQNSQPFESQEFINLARLWQPVWYSIETDSHKNCALLDTKWLGMSNHSSARLPGVSLDGKSKLMLRFQINTPGGNLKIHLNRSDGPLLLALPLKKQMTNLEIESFDFQEVAGKHDLFLIYENPKLAAKPDDFGLRLDWFSFSKKFPGAGKPGQKLAEQNFMDLMRAGCETVPVMFENPSDFRRKNYVFERGNWLVHGQEIEPATPKHFNKFPENAPADRLGLARWLTSPENPLTARVLVNRLWEQIFGLGLVETLEDFGSQGAEPSHPELLDFLAFQFVQEQNWSIKKVLRELVLSSTYRQNSDATAAKISSDPENRWLSRGAKIRLSGEQIRDNALAISGLLSPKMFGKPVMPPQPEGIWQVPYNGDSWQNSLGEDSYRRAVYTFWKRSSPYPSLMTFDGAARQVCTARRVRTNTPLQALVTLNDPVFVECAQNFALKLYNSTAEKDFLEKIKTGFRQAAGQEISTEKLKILSELYQNSLKHYQNRSAETKFFLKYLEEKNQTAELAAMAVVCNVLLNLDEILTKS